MNIHSYEDWGVVSQMPMEFEYPLLEAWSGSKVVEWWGRIDRQLKDMVEKYRAKQNWDYTNKLQLMRNTWLNNQLTGSINREDVVALKAACDMLAIDQWNLSDYFSKVRDQLAKLLASMEELPAPMDQEPGEEAESPTPMTAFGPEEENPEQPENGELPPPPGQQPPK